MNKKGYTTESGGRQNGFAIEPEINPITQGESKKSFLLFIGILLVLKNIFPKMIYEKMFF